jgi:hypothetical protein
MMEMMLIILMVVVRSNSLAFVADANVRPSHA